jgi:putative transposase
MCVLFVRHPSRKRALMMANTFTQVHIHAVFAVKFRNALILPSWKDRFHQYITGIVQGNGHKMLAINSMPDHMHILFGLRPTQSLADVMRMAKCDSSEWVNKNRLSSGDFKWQAGYSAFSYSKWDLKRVADYVENQQDHHRQRTFLEEHAQLLEAFEIEYDRSFIFKPLE